MSFTSRSGIDPPDALSRRIQGAIREQRASTLRPRLRNAVALIIAGLLTIGVIAAASQFVYGAQLLGIRAGVRSSALLAIVAVALFGLLLASTFAALWRGRSGLGPSTATLTVAALTIAPLYALLALAFPVHERATTVASVSISPWGTRCFVIASFVGAIVLGCFASAMRAAAPVGTRARGMALGSAAGAWAGLAVFVFCPSGDALHIFLGHVLPIAALAMLGALALPPILKP